MRKSATERKKEILEAALPEFIQEGIAGARLQAIADQIDVTKAMIHYYFGSKEKLFEAVFAEACNTLLVDLWRPLEEETPLFRKIDRFIDGCLQRLQKKPELSYFVIGELNRHPRITRPLFRQNAHFNSRSLDQQLSEAAGNYEIAQVDSNQLLVTILSLCFFPYSAQTFMQEVLPGEEGSYQKILAQGSDNIKDTVINWLVG